jgi:alkylation response protein AidB-like acyl-CoA dehydrogenase
VPLAPQLLALAALVAHPAHRGLVERLVAGTALGAVAWTPTVDAVQRTGEDGQPALSGRLGPVEGASVADVVVVVVPDGVYLVDLAITGRPPAEPAMDLTRTLSWLILDGTPSTRLGGAEEAARLGALGALATSAELLGGSDRVLEMASQYAKDRIQFGVPIGSFQAVKHRCADMLVDVEGMRSATWYAAWALSTAEPGWELAAATAKVWCADASRRVMASGLQVHGGIGFTWEHDLHLYLKRAQFAQLAYGDAAYHRDQLATGLRAAVLAGDGVM